MLGPMMAMSAPSRTTARHIPVVVVGHDTHAGSMDSVRNDDEAGAAAVVDHLVGLGHERIAHIHAGAVGGSRGRREGYEAAMVRHGLGDHVRSVRGAFTEDGGMRAMGSIIESGDLPTAVFVANDLAAMGALEALAAGRDSASPTTSRSWATTTSSPRTARAWRSRRWRSRRWRWAGPRSTSSSSAPRGDVPSPATSSCRRDWSCVARPLLRPHDEPRASRPLAAPGRCRVPVPAWVAGSGGWSASADLRFDDYDAAWRGRRRELGAFWESVWDYYGVRSETPYERARSRALASPTLAGSVEHSSTSRSMRSGSAGEPMTTSWCWRGHRRASRWR